MKKSLAAVSLIALLAPAAAFAEGYGVVEHHAEGVAMGGAAMFIENDAGNMAYNPVGITLCEGTQIKVSAVNINPHGDYSAVPVAIPGVGVGPTEYGHNRVHSAWAPGAFYVRKLDDKQWWGIGCFSRFGNMCEFEAGSLPATNNRFAKMNGLSITPTYARKAGSKFYWAVGADINYVGLTLEKDFAGHPYSALGQYNPIPFTKTEAKGESWALGWNLGFRYAATEKDEFGFAYRSRMKHNMTADFFSNYPDTTCWGEVMLPDSYHFGYSHKFDQKNRVELGAIRTNWSNFKELVLHIGSPISRDVPSYHNWKDNWRYAIGFEHKFSKKYTGMLGFAFDESGIPVSNGSYMVPIGTRKTYTVGMKYTDKWHTVALTLGWQVEGDHNWVGQSTDGYSSARMYDSSAAIFGIGYTYHF